MNQKHELQAIERRERRIDEALKETFPASDPPSFVGAGAQTPNDDQARIRKRRTKAAEMAGEAIDRQADQSATAEERESRKRRLLKGPAEFRELRRNHEVRDDMDKLDVLVLRRAELLQNLEALRRCPPDFSFDGIEPPVIQDGRSVLVAKIA